MRPFIWIGRRAAWIFLLLSLAFAMYLYPGPTDGADSVIKRAAETADGSSSSSNAHQLGDAEKDEIYASFRRSWTVNLGLLILGIVASIFWISLYRFPKGWWAAGATITLMAFVSIFVVIVSAQDGGIFDWLRRLWDSLATFVAIGKWRYAAIEAHRLLSFGFSILGLIFVAAAWKNLPSRS
jgi:hypothetical protein